MSVDVGPQPSSHAPSSTLSPQHEHAFLRWATAHPNIYALSNKAIQKHPQLTGDSPPRRPSAAAFDGSPSLSALAPQTPLSPSHHSINANNSASTPSFSPSSPSSQPLPPVVPLSPSASMMHHHMRHQSDLAKHNAQLLNRLLTLQQAKQPLKKPDARSKKNTIQNHESNMLQRKASLTLFERSPKAFHIDDSKQRSDSPASPLRATRVTLSPLQTPPTPSHTSNTTSSPSHTSLDMKQSPLLDPLPSSPSHSPSSSPLPGPALTQSPATRPSLAHSLSSPMLRDEKEPVVGVTTLMESLFFQGAPRTQFPTGDATRVAHWLNNEQLKTTTHTSNSPSRKEKEMTPPKPAPLVPSLLRPGTSYLAHSSSHDALQKAVYKEHGVQLPAAITTTTTTFNLREIKSKIRREMRHASFDASSPAASSSSSGGVSPSPSSPIKKETLLQRRQRENREKQEEIKRILEKEKEEERMKREEQERERKRRAALEAERERLRLERDAEFERAKERERERIEWREKILQQARERACEREKEKEKQRRERAQRIASKSKLAPPLYPPPSLLSPTQAHKPIALQVLLPIDEASDMIEEPVTVQEKERLESERITEMAAALQREMEQKLRQDAIEAAMRDQVKATLPPSQLQYYPELQDPNNNTQMQGTHRLQLHESHRSHVPSHHPSQRGPPSVHHSQLAHVPSLQQVSQRGLPSRSQAPIETLSRPVSVRGPPSITHSQLTSPPLAENAPPSRQSTMSVTRTHAGPSPSAINAPLPISRSSTWRVEHVEPTNADTPSSHAINDETHSHQPSLDSQPSSSPPAIPSSSPSIDTVSPAPVESVSAHSSPVPPSSADTNTPPPASTGSSSESVNTTPLSPTLDTPTNTSGPVAPIIEEEEEEVAEEPINELLIDDTVLLNEDMVEETDMAGEELDVYEEDVCLSTPLSIKALKIFMIPVNSCALPFESLDGSI